jgi:hypothetical protein
MNAAGGGVRGFRSDPNNRTALHAVPPTADIPVKTSAATIHPELREPGCSVSGATDGLVFGVNAAASPGAVVPTDLESKLWDGAVFTV